MCIIIDMKADYIVASQHHLVTIGTNQIVSHQFISSIHFHSSCPITRNRSLIPSRPPSHMDGLLVGRTCKQLCSCCDFSPLEVPVTPTNNGILFSIIDDVRRNCNSRLTVQHQFRHVDAGKFHLQSTVSSRWTRVLMTDTSKIKYDGRANWRSSRSRSFGPI